MKREQQEANKVLCLEIASGVYCLEIGKGFNRSNVYFVKSGVSWVLIDTASENCDLLIRKVAESLFGSNSRPASILLTHVHPDHDGSALELAKFWNCPVYMHADELSLATVRDIPTVEKYANPLDHWIVLPLLRAMPRQKVEAMLLKTSLNGIAQGLVQGAAIPNLPDWVLIPTPGHTPGHIAFFRPSDRLLITGDAIVTADLNSFWGLLLWSFNLNKQRFSAPPRYSTWNWHTAKEAVTVLAELDPHVLASGHGMPFTGDKVAHELRSFADHFSGSADKKPAKS